MIDTSTTEAATVKLSNRVDGARADAGAGRSSTVVEQVMRAF